MTQNNQNAIRPPQAITNQEFLEEIFGGEWHHAHVTSFANDPSDIAQEFRGACWAGGMAKNKLRDMARSENQYYTISLFHPDPTDDKRKRRKSLFDATFVIVVDDVFEKIPKAQADLLPAPSYKLLTSEGSHQWGYILTEPENNSDRVNNLLDGLIAKGLAPDGVDTGMKGVTRYIRLPEGSNTKAKRCDEDGNPFKCELYEWYPKRTYSLEEIGAAYTIDINASREASGAIVGILPDQYPDMPHPILPHINITGRGGDGWLRIDCLNVAKHTDDDPSGAAIQILQDGRINYECHHGHCQGSAKHKKFTGVEAVKFLDKQHKGFMDAYYDHQSEIKKLGVANLIHMQTQMLGTAEDIDQLTQTVIDAPSQIDGMNPLDYYFVKASGQYYEKRTGTIMTKDSFNAYFKRLHSGGKGDPLASTLYLENMTPASMSADGFTWNPTTIKAIEPQIIQHEGRNLINSWRGLYASPIAGDVTPWLDLLAFIVPDEVERKHVLQWTANLVQNVGKKPNWQLLFLGTHRNGKDSLFKPISRMFGSCAADVTPEELKKGWGDYLARKKFLCIQEIYQPQNKEFANNLKNLAASTTSGLTKLNMKGGQVLEQNDCLAFVGFSNHKNAMVVEFNDKRYFTIDCFFDPNNDEFYANYHDWLDGDGSLAVNHILHYLLNNVDLSDFSPARSPYITEGTRRLIDMGQPDYVQLMGDLVEEATGIFARKAITLKALHSYMQANGNKMGRNGLANGLELLGYERYRGKAKIDGNVVNTPHFYSRDLLHTYGAKDLYDYYTENCGALLPQ